MAKMVGVDSRLVGERVVGRVVLIKERLVLKLDNPLHQG